MNFFDHFLIYFGYFIVLSFITAIIGLFIFKGKSSETSSKKYKKLGLIFIIQLIVFFALLYSLHGIFNQMVKNDFLTTINSGNIVLKINGENVDSEFCNQLVQDLGKFNSPLLNHSGPTTEIKIEIFTNEKSLKLSLFRNSQDPSIYYVHINNYKTSEMNDIGQIRTKLLDKY